MNVRELLASETGYHAVDVEEVRTATDHKVFRCDDAFYVKVGGRDDFTLERNAHELAASVGVPVPEVVATGDTFLISRAVGGVMLSEHLRPPAIEDAGRCLRALHDVPRTGFGWPVGSEVRGEHATWFQHIAAELDWSVAPLKDIVDVDVVLEASERRSSEIDDIDIGRFLHGDCSPWNVLVEPASGVVTAVIDWADAMVGDPVWDVAVFTSWVPDVTDALLAGYEPESRERFDSLLPFYRACRHMWGYRAGIEDGWDESKRIPILKQMIERLSGSG